MEVEFSFKAVSIQDAKKEVLRRLEALKEVKSNGQFLNYLKVDYSFDKAFIVHGKDRLKQESFSDVLSETNRDKETEAETKERIENSIIEYFTSEAFNGDVTVNVVAFFSDELPS